MSKTQRMERTASEREQHGGLLAIAWNCKVKASHGPAEEFGFYPEGPREHEEESPSNNDITFPQTWLSLPWEGLGTVQMVG